MSKSAPKWVGSRVRALGLGAAGAATLACAGSPPAVSHPIPLSSEQAATTPEARSQALALTVEALHELADARRNLLMKDAARPQLEAARSRIAEARALLPPDVLRLETRPGQRLRILQPRDRLSVPLHSIDPERLRRLRPYRFASARALKVDLGELERRLERALEGPPERMHGEVLLAARSALRFELGDGET